MDAGKEEEVDAKVDVDDDVSDGAKGVIGEEAVEAIGPEGEGREKDGPRECAGLIS